MLDLEFKLKPSKFYLLLQMAILIASGVIVLCLPVAMWLMTILLLVLSIYGAYMLWQFGFLLSPYSVISLRRHQDGSWLLQTNNKTYNAELRGDSTVTGFVSVLRFRLPKQSWPLSCIIFRDSLQADFYRRLLVVLKMY
jgi:hypothetical protein